MNVKINHTYIFTLFFFFFGTIYAIFEEEKKNNNYLLNNFKLINGCGSIFVAG